VLLLLLFVGLGGLGLFFFRERRKFIGDEKRGSNSVVKKKKKKHTAFKIALEGERQKKNRQTKGQRKKHAL
jgi:hypothetical protein